MVPQWIGKCKNWFSTIIVTWRAIWEILICSMGFKGTPGPCCPSWSLSFSFMWVSDGFPSGSVVKNPPSMQEARVQSLGQEDPPEEGMAVHSSILAWRIPWTEGPQGLQSPGSQQVRHDWVTEQLMCLLPVVYLQESYLGWDSLFPRVPSVWNMHWPYGHPIPVEVRGLGPPTFYWVPCGGP